MYDFKEFYKYFIDHVQSENLPCLWNRLMCSWAARNGHSNILQWVRSQDPPCPWDKYTPQIFCKIWVFITT
jgi:hypothetical protein